MPSFTKPVLAVFTLFYLTGCSLTQHTTQSPQPVLIDPMLEPIEVVPNMVAQPEPLPVIEVQQKTLTQKPLTPQQVDNLWLRIAMQLELSQAENKQIISQRNWYLKHASYIDRISKRAQPYLYLIVAEIEKRGLPLELALLPIVESAFDPFAYSHGRASGMWQIIAGTGKRFGLAQNWWYDGRRDVYASTHAALDYLEYLHQYFKGDWLHAIAAYNSGEGRVGRAIKKNRKAGKATDFWSLKLPKETKDYVPRLLALAQILKQPQHFKVEWPTIANRQTVKIVNTQSQIDLAFAAKLAGMELNDLHRLNPGFNRWATDPNGSHQLLMPLKNAELFVDKLAQTAKKDRVNWIRYQIKNGDSLGLIASRHQTTIGVIQDVNDIQSSSIRAGKYLLIPVATNKLSDYKLTARSRLSKKQATSRKGFKRTHIVSAGDNFWDIGRKYQVNYKAVAKWNGMAPKDPLRLGQKLVIWTKGTTTKTSNNAIMRNITYKVRNGDSIARIAQKFSLKMADVIRWNSLNAKKYLQPGQKLKLYVDVTQINS